MTLIKTQAFSSELLQNSISSGVLAFNCDEYLLTVFSAKKKIIKINHQLHDLLMQDLIGAFPTKYKKGCLHEVFYFLLHKGGHSRVYMRCYPRKVMPSKHTK